MKVFDPGHVFLMDSIDGGKPVKITFVKREGLGYPGNKGHHPGTNLQELLRVFIARTQYLNNQQPCNENQQNISAARLMLMNLESRAARRHGLHEKDVNQIDLENIPYCSVCGHWVCKGHPK